jgi:hypothetical protein
VSNAERWARRTAESKERARLLDRTLAYDNLTGRWHWRCIHGCVEPVRGPDVGTFEECESGWERHKLDCHLPSNGQILRSMGVKIGKQKRSL